MVKESMALEIVENGTDVEENIEFYSCCIYIFLVFTMF